jgi:glycosyltransferase involved in cell wall biosynthesis
MNIAILTSSFPRTHGDYHGNFIFHQARGQVERGNEVHVICPHVPGAPFHEVMDGITVHRFPYFYPYHFQRLASDTGMYSALRRSFLAVLQLPLFLVSEWWCTWRVIHRYRIDLIHSHWFVPSGLIGALLRRFTGIPHVATVHGSDVNILKKYMLLHPFCRFITRNSSFITVNSTYMKRQLLMVSPGCTEMVRVIPMGIDPEQFVSLKNSDIRARYPAEYIIFSAGRLIELKGITYLIEAMPGILSRFPDTRLLIAGDGPEKENLIKKIQTLNLGSRVTLLGTISHQDLPAYYHSADIFVLPSIFTSGMTEALGVVLLEAMASGCPVIGSNIGGIPDIITDGENGFLVPERNPVILAEKIILLLSDISIAEQFRQRGHETVRIRFSWEKISRQFSEIYVRVLDKYSKERAP